MSKATDELEEYFSLPHGFFQNLQNESDWSFVVSLHALLETACSVLLAEELAHPEIAEAFSKVQMGTRSNGKLAFISALELLQEHEVAFLEALGELRNKFAHNVSNTQATVASIIASMKSKRRNQCLKALGMEMVVSTQGVERPAANLARESPRAVIWVSSNHILKMIHLRMIGAGIRRELIAKWIAEHVEANGPIRLREGVASLEQVR